MRRGGKLVPWFGGENPWAYNVETEELIAVFKIYCFPSNLEEFIVECYSPGIDRSNLQEDEHSTDSKFSA